MSYASSRRAWAEIDLAALERNFRRIRAALPRHIQYMAVVKADAYGHGMAQTTSRLMQGGADAFAVANVHEAAELREIGTGWPILVLSAVLPEEDHWLLEHDLVATVSTPDEVERFEALGAREGRPVRVHLKIDTGMARLGVWHTNAPALVSRIAACRHVRLEGVFTHFSSAGTDLPFTRRQRELFLGVLGRCPELQAGGLTIHADNSAGLESFSPDSPFNAVRVGLLQYGLVPYRDSILSGLRPEPVLSFHSRVGIVKDVPAGTRVSYGGTHRLERDTRLAVVTAGYGDGLATGASNRGQVLVRGRRCPILGRVTMDQTILDVSGLDEVRAGDIVTIIGSQSGERISVEEFCAWTGEIPWEVFTSITRRVPRVYRTSLAQGN